MYDGPRGPGGSAPTSLCVPSLHVYVCMYVCMYVCIYIYIYVQT